jgi:hypothetical protein
VGDLVGEHPVLAELEHGVAAAVAELPHRVEHVDGEALEGAVDAGEAQHGVGVAGGFVEERRLAVLADAGAHPLAQLDRDLAVAGFVPALAGHVELQLERHGVGLLLGDLAHREVPARATGALERLDLADEDAVHQLAGGVGRIGARRHELARAAVGAGRVGGAAVGDPIHHVHPVEPGITSELVGGEDLLHPATST